MKTWLTDNNGNRPGPGMEEREMDTDNTIITCSLCGRYIHEYDGLDAAACQASSDGYHDWYKQIQEPTDGLEER